MVLVRVAEAEAPAKVILVGEHFCVHGAPAVSMAINLYARVKVRLDREKKGVKVSMEGVPPTFKVRVAEGKVEALYPLKMAVEEVLRRASEKLSKPLPGLEVKISSQIPVGAGLGSSASLASATIAASARILGLNPSKEAIIELCSIPERFIHGNPSGIDPTTVVLGGMIVFRRGQPPVRLSPAKPLSLIVGDTGVRRTTGLLVQKFSEILSRKVRAEENLKQKEPSFEYTRTNCLLVTDSLLIYCSFFLINSSVIIP